MARLFLFGGLGERGALADAWLLQLSPRFYARMPLGQIVSRLNNDVGEIQRVATDVALAPISNVLFLVGTIAILAWLDRKPGVTQTELATLAELSTMTVARLIDRLEEQGLVRRCNDEGDRRIWRLRLTPEAEPLLRNIAAYRAKLHSVLAEGIEPITLEAMATGLARMKSHLNAARRNTAAKQDEPSHDV